MASINSIPATMAIGKILHTFKFDPNKHKFDKEHKRREEFHFKVPWPQPSLRL